MKRTNLTWLCAITALALSILAICGCLFKMPVLCSFIAGFPQTYLHTSITLCLLSLAVICAAMVKADAGEKWVPIAVRVLAISAMVVPLATAGARVAAWPSEFPGWMSIPVCLTALSLAIAAFFHSFGLKRRYQGAREFFALIPVPGAILALIIFFFTESSPAGMAKLSGLSFPSAFSILILSLGLLSRENYNGIVSVFFGGDSAGRISRKLALVAMILPVTTGLFIREGENSGLFSSSFEDALFTLLFAITLLFFALQTGRWIRTSERQVLKNNRHKFAVREANRRLGAVNEIKNRMLRALESSNIGYWEWDVATGQVDWSELQSKIFGFAEPVERIRVEDIFKNVHPDDMGPTDAAVKAAVEAKREFDTEFRVITHKGKVRWLAGRGRAEYGADGAPVRIVGVNFDVTERRVATDRIAQQAHSLREAERALIGAKEEAEAANSHKTAFLANMSHEIRTPLTAITGFVDLLRKNKVSQHERLVYLDIVHRNGSQLLSLINDILDFSKVESGKFVVESIECRVADVVSDTVSSMTSMAHEKGLKLACELGEGVPATIGTDPARLRQILLNLLNNAVKFSFSGRIVLKAEMRPNGQILFSVTDRGIGISEEHAAELFLPFVQADASVTRKFGGTGLGLSLSRNLARALGGDVVLKESRVGQGSTFEVTVENRPVAVSSTRVEKPPVISTELPLDGIRILLVEDAEDNQELISTMLTQLGARVDIAGNGFTGAEKAMSEDFEIILLDLQMPVMDGYSAVKTLRAHAYQKPVVALTAHATSDVRRRCAAAGFDDYLTKPIDWEALTDAILKLVRRVGPDMRVPLEETLTGY